MIKGGITGMMKIAHLAEAYGMNCEIHDGYNAMNNVANLNVAMAIDNCDWFEILAFNRSGEHGLEHRATASRSRSSSTPTAISPRRAAPGSGSESTGT